MIAERLSKDPSLVERARRRVSEWSVSGSVSEPYIAAWATLLHGPTDELVGVLRDRGDRGRELRQASPFAGAVDPRTRWTLWRQERERYEGS